MIGTAQASYPKAIIDGGEPIFCQRGVSVGWLLGIGTRTVTFVAVVTGIGNEVIVHEIPEGGAVLRDRFT